jgi:O-methyltransferase involved in polyketide biosynthesis
MENDIKEDVSGTAFVVNYSRSLRVDISRDVYAKLWVTPESVALYDELSEQVFPHDDMSISLRNRFYLEQINAFCSQHPQAVYVGIAAGFTNYPFLADGISLSVEVDLPYIMALKKKQVGIWQKEGLLPERSIEFIPADLMVPADRLNMKNALKSLISDKPSIITMEGLTYYLDEPSVQALFDIALEVQQNGSLLVFDYWKPDTMDYPVMQRLKKFMELRFGYTERNWVFLDRPQTQAIRGYRELLSSEIATLERNYADSRIFQGRDNKVPVNFAVLEKTEL